MFVLSQVDFACLFTHLFFPHLRACLLMRELETDRETEKGKHRCEREHQPVASHTPPPETETVPRPLPGPRHVT